MDGWMDQGVGTIPRGFWFAEASHTGAKVWDSLPDNNVCPLCATWRQQTITSSTKQWRQSVGNIPALPVYMNTKKNWFISRWYRYIFSAFTSICHISSKRNCFKTSWIDGRTDAWIGLWLSMNHLSFSTLHQQLVWREHTYVSSTQHTRTSRKSKKPPWSSTVCGTCSQWAASKRPVHAGPVCCAVLLSRNKTYQWHNMIAVGPVVVRTLRLVFTSLKTCFKVNGVSSCPTVAVCIVTGANICAGCVDLRYDPATTLAQVTWHGNSPRVRCERSIRRGFRVKGWT